MRLAALRGLIVDAVEAVTVPASAQSSTVTTLRHVPTMDMVETGLDDLHLTFLVEHRASQYRDRRNSLYPETSTQLDVVVQVRARISTIDAQTDVDAGLDVVDAIRYALCGDLGTASVMVEAVDSFGPDESATRYSYGLRVVAVHQGG
jgi:hypothetical protein